MYIVGEDMCSEAKGGQIPVGPGRRKVTLRHCHEECNNVTKRFGIEVSGHFLCVTQSGRTAPCTRDTGAPAVSDGILWGLASWGLRKLCGTERYPAMFSYVASRRNMDFIANATHYLMSEKREYPFLDRFPFDPQPKPVYQGVPSD